jgi:hypothetical protein
MLLSSNIIRISSRRISRVFPSKIRYAFFFSHIPVTGPAHSILYFLKSKISRNLFYIISAGNRKTFLYFRLWQCSDNVLILEFDTDPVETSTEVLDILSYVFRDFYSRKNEERVVSYRTSPVPFKPVHTLSSSYFIPVGTMEPAQLK